MNDPKQVRFRIKLDTAALVGRGVDHDTNGRVYISGATLRGAIRSQFAALVASERVGGNAIAKLFGNPNRADLFSVSNAVAVAVAVAESSVGTRTREFFEPLTGTAVDSRLDTVEEVGPGTVFEGALLLSRSLNAQEAFALQLSMKGISSIGPGRALGFGSCTFEVLDPAATEESVYVLDPQFQPLAKSEQPALSVWLPDTTALLIAHLAKYPDETRSLPPREFEKLVAELLRRDGFEVELTPMTRDGGYDILAIRNDHFCGKHTYLVECKRYADSRPVRIDVVRSLLGVVHAEHATKGVVVTTSHFTTDAKKHAERFSTRLALRDFDMLKSWLKAIGVNDDG